MALASSVIGKVFVSKGSVTAVSDQGRQTALVKGSEVFLFDTIITAEDSFLVVKMNDGTKLTLRPKTEITLDNFSEEKGNEKATIGLLKGGLRTLTGSIGKKRPDQFLLKTPTATIGIRGTNFIVRICEGGSSGKQCGNQCAVEEQQLNNYQRLAANPENGNPDGTVALGECEPVGQITDGLYVGVFEGRINAAGKSNDIDLAAPGAAKLEKSNPKCMTEVPNFLTLDPYLSEDPETTVDEFKRTVSPSNLLSRTEELLKQGFSAYTIINNEISKGNAINAIVKAASIASPERETEFRWLADMMLPGFPDSACNCQSFQQDRPWNEITYDSLEQKTVAEVTRLFFEEDKHLARFDQNNSHGLFPVRELAKLLEESSLWYRILPVRDHPMPASVFVSLYKNGEEVVVDGNLAAVQHAMEQGDEYMPVLFHYFWESTIPIGRFPKEITSGDVAGVLGDITTVISPAPHWEVGGYHAVMTINELKALVFIPEKDDIDPELWARIESDLRVNGFIFPVILTPGSGFGDYQLFNSVERVAVAEGIGQPSIPVLLLEPPWRPIVISQCRRVLRNDDSEQEFSRFRGGAGGPPPPDSPPPDLPPQFFTPPPVSP